MEIIMSEYRHMKHIILRKKLDDIKNLAQFEFVHLCSYVFG